MEPHISSQPDDNNSIKVLVYHRIADDEMLRRIHWSYVSSAQLRHHLDLLNSWGFTPITLADFSLCVRGDISLPRRPVILTFENGYRNMHRYAFPVLKEFGVHAVSFVLGDRSIKTDEWDRHLGLSPEELITDEQLIELNEAGMEIGSHSMTHASLTSLQNVEAMAEIDGSKASLESLLKSRVISFSYPFGSTDKRIRDLVISSGYEYACGIDSGSPQFGDDFFNIRRITITSSTNTLSFAVKMLTPFEQAEWVGTKATSSIRDAWNAGYREGNTAARVGRIDR